MRPLIAIPEPTSTDSAYNQRSLPQYIQALEAADAVAVPIPLDASEAEQEALFRTCAAILLPGSPADLDPAKYGESLQEKTAPKDSLREAVDERLLRDASAQGKPILCICYGLQSLNVWLGGSLIQDVPSAKGLTVNHAPGRTVERAHTLEVVPGSRLSHILGGGEPSPSGGELFVNSSHHQAVAKAGRSLNVVGTSPVDGVIEALEGQDPKQFVLGVQWHPERTYESSDASRALFAAFVEAARTSKP